VIAPSPEPIAGSTSTGDCDKVKAVVGDHDTVWGALVMVNVTNVEVSEYVAFAGAVAATTHEPGAVYEITAEVELTVQPDRPAEFTEYDGVPEPMLITASADAADPESAAVSVVVGLQVIERVANPTLIVSVIGADALCDAVAPATTCTVQIPADVNTRILPLVNEQPAVPTDVTE
jgi:hypothetical protein